MFVGQQEATSPRRTGRPQPAACALVSKLCVVIAADGSGVLANFDLIVFVW